MKHLALLLPIVLLAACGQEPAPQPTVTPTATPEPVNSLPPADQEAFTAAFAAGCEGAEPVKTAVCKRAMGSKDVSCEYGLGDDEFLRHKAVLTVNDENTGWVLADPAKICAEHGAHHKAS